jgi:hypothetical protein
MNNNRFKALLLVASALLTLHIRVQAQAQQSNKTIHVYVLKIQQATAMLNAFIAQHNALVYNTDLSTDRYFCRFSIPPQALAALDSMADKMGYVTGNTYNTENISEKIEQAKERISELTYENSLYAAQLKDTVYSQEVKDGLRRKIAENMQNINRFEITVNNYQSSATGERCYVEFTVHDELSTPNNSRVSFVNMPGVEYGYLFIENPKPGVSTKAYQGVTIKYMFTRGKSYFNLGVYRTLQNNVSDTSLINELFLINFGQDFYPKHFGRGKRKFFNLYTGYQLGGYITNQNNEKHSVFVPNLNLSFGLELFKSKHVLVDTKASYFLPLNELNRNMRGVLCHASFNFVF